MIVAGLTGSLAMGKTETAKMFAAHGIPVFDSDAEVHRLYGKGGEAVPLIERAFPSAVSGGSVDRARLSELVTSDPQSLAMLESLVHPLVESARDRFLREARRKNHRLVLLDVPLLFETGLDRIVDKVIVVSAPAHIQRQRALARNGMTPEKLDSILSRQLPDAEKRRRADFIVDSSRGIPAATAQVGRIVAELLGKAKVSRP